MSTWNPVDSLNVLVDRSPIECCNIYSQLSTIKLTIDQHLRLNNSNIINYQLSVIHQAVHRYLTYDIGSLILKYCHIEYRQYYRSSIHCHSQFLEQTDGRTDGQSGHNRSFFSKEKRPKNAYDQYYRQFC